VSALLTPSHATTRSVPQRDQFGLWQDLNADVIELDLLDRSARGFPAEQVTWTLGGLTLTHANLKGAPARLWRHRARSYLDHWCVVLARAAGPTSTSSQLGVRFLSSPFEGRGHDEDVISLYIPRDLLGLDPSTFGSSHQPPLTGPMADLVRDYLLSLVRTLPTLSQAQIPHMADAARALVAACLMPSADCLAQAQAPIGHVLIERARRIVRDNMADPDFSPEHLCRQLAVSRSKLYRAFESVGGVARVIQRERLQEAHRRLVNPLRACAIHVIGLDVGFLDHSTFSRAFRREFGYAPSEACEQTGQRQEREGHAPMRVA
jgi:AraC-like DNA-binding protein